MPIHASAWLCVINSLHRAADIKGLTAAAPNHGCMYGISERKDGKSLSTKLPPSLSLMTSDI